jgi:hypothetical protein
MPLITGGIFFVPLWLIKTNIMQLLTSIFTVQGLKEFLIIALIVAVIIWVLILIQNMIKRAAPDAPRPIFTIAWILISVIIIVYLFNHFGGSL